MTFETLLSPVNLQEFLNEFYLKRGLYIKNTGTKFQNVFSYEALNNILNYSPSPHPTLKLVKEAKPIITNNEAEILNAIKNGASLIIDKIHKYNYDIGFLTRSISYSLNEPTQVNLYLSQPDIKGFDLHYDTHDVFILQVEGYKVWKVYEPTLKYPVFDMKTHEKNPPQEPYIDVILSPGDVLYIPRGHWHVALATKEASLHLTLGINSRTGLDFLNWLKDELTENELWRQEFPPTHFENNECEGRIKHYEKLRDSLISILMTKNIYDRYNVFNISTDKKMGHFNFPEQFNNKSETWTLTTNFSFSPFKKHKIEFEDDLLILYCEGSVIRLKKESKEIIEMIFKNSRFTLGDLIKSLDNFTENQIKSILSVLAKQDILFVRNTE